MACEAEFKVTRIVPLADGSIPTISACKDHVSRIMEELNATKVLLETADPAMHTCMGCLKGW